MDLRNIRIRQMLTYLVTTGIFLPSLVFAQTSNVFEMSGWVPYWRSQRGVEDTLPHMSILAEVNPFMYTVRSDGSLIAESSLTREEWIMLKNAAKAQNVRYIPTILWTDGSAIDAVLRDPARRKAHIDAITREVYAHDLDGIDIDYESKLARTKPYFSLFLKELYEAIGYDKWVMCTIEPRTPIEARFATPEAIPANIEFANDYAEINKYCDRVRIMAYDQGRIDVPLNRENEHPYIPIADIAWVEKVMRLAMEDIDRDKLVIGVPTYGYEYDMFRAPAGWMDYARLWSFNPGYAHEVSAQLGIQPVRNSAGELVLTYPASQATSSSIPRPDATRVMTWSDAGSVRQKIELARELGLRGVAVFKFDAGQDPDLWDVLTEYAGLTIPTDRQPVAPPQQVVDQPPAQTTPPSTPHVAIPIPARDLFPGATGDDVRNLQRLLNMHGHLVAMSGPGAPGNETTLFGVATRAALVRFQQSHGIAPATGNFGPLTRARMSTLSGTQVSSPSTSTSPPTTGTGFTRDLTIGMVGTDVLTLQRYLNANGFLVAQNGPGAPGNETMMFGALTRNALIRFQRAHNISPAVGYFGPVTRAFVQGT